MTETPTVAELDYRGTQILIHVTNQIEMYRARSCAKEPWTVAWIDAMKPGDVFYDVGANIGAYTLIAAKRGLHVVAFEPAFANHARLCENLILNKVEAEVVPICAALAASSGILHFGQAPIPGAASGDQHAIVPQLAMDTLRAELNLPFPTHIKVDTDGSERGVLEGGWCCLENALSVMIEMGHDGDAAVVDLMQRASYQRTGYWPVRGIAYALYERR